MKPEILKPWAWLLLAGLTGAINSYGTAENAKTEPKAPPTALAHFQEHVAPVLSAKCISCHNSHQAKGGLDLSSRAGMVRGGDSGAALLPGDPQASSLYTRTLPHGQDAPEMPEKGEPLTAPETEALHAWIAANAPWPEKLVLRERAKADADFWSLQPIKVETPPMPMPMPTTAPHGWLEHPVDRFILAKLREKGLQPNGPASPRPWIRRVTYDLIGLPPTPEEIEQFVRECAAETGNTHDTGDDACQRLVDRLLASPHYGERWGRHWLDVIRFGESRGYERNEIITNLWPFRDYIIRSFNEDKPFDRMVLEHLAGDVVGKDQPGVEIGSAFLVAGPYDDVGNQDPAAAAQIRADQMDEMIRATSETFLGLTLGCARCHDHKFDPLLTKDYYALYSTFAGTFHGAREVATAQERADRQARLAPLIRQRESAVAQAKTLREQQSRRAAQREANAAQQWRRPRASRYGTEDTFAPVLARHVRLQVEGNDAPDGGPHAFKLDEFEVWTNEPAPRNVALASAGASARGAARDAKDFAGAYGPDLTIDGKFGERWHAAGNELVITFAKPETIRRVFFSSDRTRALPEDNPLTVFVGEYKISVSLDGKEWRPVASSDDRQPASAARKQARLLKLASAMDTEKKDAARAEELQREIARLDAAIARIPALPVWWVGTHQPALGPFHLFSGGNPQRKGEVVVPASFSTLAPLASAYRLEPPPDEGARRLALARWIIAPDHPLTARVLANRLWQYHFGTGIVDTPSDFGYLGGRPTHPELLDWLAKEIQNHGWRLKPIHRMLTLSRVYRQSGAWREEAARVDGDSRWLWRFPPRRLSAEEVRDTMLVIAGKLDRRMGGPGFRLYEYQQDNVATYVPLDQHGPETYRRSVYHHTARAARVDVMAEFDCPDPAFAQPRRAATTTPLQALTLMNHGFAVDMANFWAERLQREAPTATERVQRAFLLAYGRAPTANELQAGQQLLEQHGPRVLCRALLNTNELLHVP